jgi:Contractile injection system tube protein
MPSLPTLSLEKARLVVVEGKPAVTDLEFKYNPEHFSLSKSTEWSEAPHHQGTAQPAPPSHQRTNPAQLSMEILFDAFEEFDGDVTGDVGTLLDWTKPCDPEIAPKVRNPPLLEFRWGSSSALQGIRGYLQSVSVNYTLFRMNGTPIRATCNITLIEVPSAPKRTNPSSGSRPGYRAHVLIEGESLHSVAWAEYRRADYWRAIAAYNDIDDPLRVAPGTRLLLPPHRDAARLA